MLLARSASRRPRLRFDTPPFDAQAARSFGGVAGSLRPSGRTSRARAFDAIIAATAMTNDLPLYTCNPRDFEGIDGLRLQDVAHPDQVT